MSSRLHLRYALHVACEDPDPESSEALQLQGEWPSAPAEEDLPHGALVGLLYVQADGHTAKSVDWKGPYHKYIVTKTVALQERAVRAIVVLRNTCDFWKLGQQCLGSTRTGTRTWGRLWVRKPLHQWVSARLSGCTRKER